MADHTQRKAELVADSMAARARMTPAVRGLRRDTDVRRKFQQGFKRNRFTWLGAAALAGLIVTIRLRRRPAKAPKRSPEPLANAGRAGVVLGVLKIVLDLLKPILIAWATKRMGDIAQASKKVERKVDRVEKKHDDVKEAVNRVDKRV